MFINFIVTLMLCLGLTCAHAQPMDAKTEYSQKAKIIKVILEKVKWPSSPPDAPINVCLFGQFAFETLFDPLQGQVVKGHKIALRHHTKYDNALKSCQLIYISESAANFAPQFIKDYKNKPVLLIADINSFAKDGGTMNFIILDQKAVGLTINVERIETSHLALNIAEFGNITIFPDEAELK